MSNVDQIVEGDRLEHTTLYELVAFDTDRGHFCLVFLMYQY